jgi:hypothetical protein
MKGCGRFAGVVVGIVALATVSAARAEYAEAPVADGGTLTGKVTFKGAVPAPKTFDFAKFPNPKFCEMNDSDGKGHRVVQEVKVGKDSALKDVVVYIEDVEKGKPFKFNGTDVKAEGCKFLIQGGPSTFAGVVVKKAEIRVENMDADPSDPKAATGVLHNPHSYEVAGASSSTIFNLPLPEKGQIIKKPVILRKRRASSRSSAISTTTCRCTSNRSRTRTTPSSAKTARSASTAFRRARTRCTRGTRRWASRK